MILALVFTLTACSPREEDKTQYAFNEVVQINENMAVKVIDDIENKKFVFEYDGKTDSSRYYFTFILNTKNEQFNSTSEHFTFTNKDDKKLDFDREHRYFFEGDETIIVTFDDYVLDSIKKNDNRYVVQASTKTFVELNK